MAFSKFTFFMALAMALSVGQTMSAAGLNQTRESYSAEVTKYSYHYLKYLPKGYDEESFRYCFSSTAPANEVVILKK